MIFVLRTGRKRKRKRKKKGKKKKKKGKRRGKGKKKKKDLTGDKTTEELLETLVRAGVVRNSAVASMEDFFGEPAFCNFELRERLKDPLPTLGDIRQASRHLRKHFKPAKFRPNHADMSHMPT